MIFYKSTITPFVRDFSNSSIFVPLSISVYILVWPFSFFKRYRSQRTCISPSITEIIIIAPDANVLLSTGAEFDSCSKCTWSKFVAFLFLHGNSSEIDHLNHCLSSHGKKSVRVFFRELSEMLLNETVALSADDKNKLNVGTLAVSRYFNQGKFFMTNDQPNYPDHDFPYSGAKLIPAGYLLLKSRIRRSRSLSPPPTFSGNV